VDCDLLRLVLWEQILYNRIRIGLTYLTVLKVP